LPIRSKNKDEHQMSEGRKTALVTGGAHRLGKAIALELGRMGYNLVINYFGSEKAAQETAAEAQTLGVDALAWQADVADFGAVQDMAAAAQAHFGGVDVLVNSASLFDKMPFPTDDSSDIETWQRVTRISMDGAFYVSNALAPDMVSRGRGVIINMVDLSVWIPWPNFTAHAVGKAALLALTRQMAVELAPSVRVNAIAPGPVLPPPDYDEQRLDAIRRRTLLRRWGSPDDVTRAVRYLVEADYVTGEVLTVDGGERWGAARQFGERQ
jgi:NAD(P)-dependent dehydrogenase (short-subunit alcohol dehydrogenase family)